MPDDTNGREDVFVKNLVTGAVRLVSTSARGRLGAGDSFDPVFSPDGRRIAFTSSAPDLVRRDTNGGSDIFVKTLASGAISRASTTSKGGQADGASYSPDFSPDGRRIAFVSGAPNLVRRDTNGSFDIFVKALASGAISRASTSSSGAQANGASYSPDFSPDGSRIAFVSDAPNLVAGDTNGWLDVFVKALHDRVDQAGVRDLERRAG